MARWPMESACAMRMPLLDFTPQLYLCKHLNETRQKWNPLSLPPSLKVAYAVHKSFTMLKVI